MALALVLAASSVLATPSVSFYQNQVLVTGLTADAEVAWLSVSIETSDWMTRVVRRDGVGQADFAGEHTIELEDDVSPVSIWAVVDLATGEVVVAAPDQAEVRQVGLAESALQREPGGAVEALALDRDFVELLIARPGSGAWGSSLGDGGASDADATLDGVTTASFATMSALGGSPAAPSLLQDLDVVVLVDPERWEVIVGTVDAGGEQ